MRRRATINAAELAPEERATRGWLLDDDLYVSLGEGNASAARVPAGGRALTCAARIPDSDTGSARRSPVPSR